MTTYRLIYDDAALAWTLSIAKVGQAGEQVADNGSVAADDPDGAQSWADCWLRTQDEVPAYWGRTNRPGAAPILYVETIDEADAMWSHTSGANP